MVTNQGKLMQIYTFFYTFFNNFANFFWTFLYFFFFCKVQSGSTLLRTAAAQVQSPDWAEAVCVKKFHQLLAVGRWFPPGAPVSSTRQLKPNQKPEWQHCILSRGIMFDGQRPNIPIWCDLDRQRPQSLILINLTKEYNLPSYILDNILVFTRQTTLKLITKQWERSQGKVIVGQGKHREFENEICVVTLI